METKRGRPKKFKDEDIVAFKALFSGERAGNRHIQNHIYQTFSFKTILDYHQENPIDNFEFLYKDNTYFKQTVFTELGRTNEFLIRHYSSEEANEYIINLAKEICCLAKEYNNKITSRIIEKIIREDRCELKKRLKDNNS